MNAVENNHTVWHETINPAFELAYWKYGLETANVWRERMELPPNKLWVAVERDLALQPLADAATSCLRM